MSALKSDTSVYDLKTPLGVRLSARAGGFVGATAGFAPGYVQGNLVILPANIANDFLQFCRLNPKSCPVISVAEAGSPFFKDLGNDLDIRTDLPGYRVWKDGCLVEEPLDLKTWWQDDLVSFVIGCSFSFEEALIEAGLEIRHIELNTNVPMYKTNIECKSFGNFSGPMVVSMRPFSTVDTIRAIEITSCFPSVHGAPIHFGDPQQIGISDIAKPDFGDAVPLREGEIPVFWACGVTPQAVIMAAKPKFAITHAPGKMIVTDVKNSSLSIR